MPSSSTGHIPATITREQPSSSGQLLTFSSGCKLNLKVDAELEMESGSTMNVEAGAHMNLAEGAYLTIQNYTSSTGHTGAAAITNYGAGVVVCEGSGIRTIDPVKGARIDFVCHSTKSTIIRGTTKASVTFGSSDTVLTVVATTAIKAIGVPLTLVGQSTVKWRVMASHPSSGAFVFITPGTAT